MDALSFIAKIGVTARVGAVFTLGAVALYALQRFHVEPFTNVDSTVYTTILILGVIGGCAVVIDLVISIWKGATWLVLRLLEWRARKAEYRRKKTTALKNLCAMHAEFVDVLLFLRQHNMRRFPADADNHILYPMQQALLLEIDDQNWSANSIITYYVVPDYVWDGFGQLGVKRPVPLAPPWKPNPDPNAWKDQYGLR